MKYALVLLLPLVGCQTMPGTTNMTPEQLTAIAKDKSFAVVCSTVAGPWGTGKFIYVTDDKGVIANGGIAVSPDCVVTMTNALSVKPPVIVPPAVAPK